MIYTRKIFNCSSKNRYDRELGGVYLHWSQVGKTLYEVFRDEHAPNMTDALCSEINHQKYYSGEFDIEWGQTITEQTHDFKKQEMEEYRAWLKRKRTTTGKILSCHWATSKLVK